MEWMKPTHVGEGVSFPLLPMQMPLSFGNASQMYPEIMLPQLPGRPYPVGQTRKAMGVTSALESASRLCWGDLVGPGRPPVYVVMAQGRGVGSWPGGG